MTESWKFDHAPAALTADAAIGQLIARIANQNLESWLTSSSGRALAVVTNTKRAMVMLLDGEGDPGEHAIDPGADGSSSGFVLAGGQNDEYPDHDTVPLPEALRIVRHILTHGNPPPDAGMEGRPLRAQLTDIPEAVSWRSWRVFASSFPLAAGLPPDTRNPLRHRKTRRGKRGNPDPGARRTRGGCGSSAG